jgi:hypothetical protein
MFTKKVAYVALALVMVANLLAVGVGSAPPRRSRRSRPTP